MADEEKQQQNKEQVQEKTKSSIFSPSVLSIILILMISEGVILFFLFKNFALDNSNSNDVNVSSSEQPVFFQLSEIKAILVPNISGQIASPFVVKPSLQLTDNSEKQKQAKKLLNAWSPKILDSIQYKMSEINFIEAREATTKLRLKSNIKQIIDSIIGEGYIEDVVFEEYMPPY